jgi:nitronate monooxygenase
MGLAVPIVNAPMGGAAGGRLAAAVSDAGGLGMIGMGSAATAESLRAELAALGGMDRPFGIGLVHWVMAAAPELFDVALAARPALLSVSFGEDWSWVRTAHDAGVPVAAQVADITAARRAVDAGVDVLVARGLEGGGHGVPMLGTLPLLAEVLDAVKVPVLAAGGIASARAVAAALAAGASGAWIGTAFATCTEALTPPPARAQLIAAASAATVTTSEFDIAAGYHWPATIPERVLLDDEGRPTPVNAGQGVGMVRTAQPAAVVIDELVRGAEALLRRF